jgi:hypothetical protein
MNVTLDQSPSGSADEVRAERLLVEVLGTSGQIASAHALMGILRRRQLRLNDSLIALRVATGLAPTFPGRSPTLE